MSSLSSNLYASLRLPIGGQPALRESATPPPEQLLQAIWQHQRLTRTQLKTADGHPVFVLHPGFLNREAGPDFHEAVIQIGQAAPVRGDVEVDLKPLHWRQHHHDSNPAFKKVVLHVVWSSNARAADPSGVPTLELENALDAPLTELAHWLSHEAPADLPAALQGKCAAPLRDLTAEQRETVLRQAGLFRFHEHANQFRARAREAGWDQTLWEGLFRALGYKHNTWPMLRLAELRPQWHKRGSTEAALVARLLGIAGLLPDDVSGRGTGRSRYLRELWDHWWRDRDEFADSLVPAHLWRLGGLRPANHPQRRLALAAHWSHLGDLPKRLRHWGTTHVPDGEIHDSLRRILQPSSTGFWSRQWTLKSSPLPRTVPLLGADRITELAANVILPWLWAIADEGGRAAVCRDVEARYSNWPGGADNAVLRMARQRLLAGAKARLASRMILQQGLHQIVRDFCAHSNSLCDACRFPEVAKQLAHENEPGDSRKQS